MGAKRANPGCAPAILVVSLSQRNETLRPYSFSKSPCLKNSCSKRPSSHLTCTSFGLARNETSLACTTKSKNFYCLYSTNWATVNLESASGVTSIIDWPSSTEAIIFLASAKSPTCLAMSVAKIQLIILLLNRSNAVLPPGRL